jgi:hypothetical protein
MMKEYCFFFLMDLYQKLRESTKTCKVRNAIFVVAKMGQTENWLTFFKDTEGNTYALSKGG